MYRGLRLMLTADQSLVRCQVEAPVRAKWGNMCWKRLDFTSSLTGFARILRRFGPLDSNHMYSSLEHRHHKVKSVNVNGDAMAQTGIPVSNLYGLVISAHSGTTAFTKRDRHPREWLREPSGPS